MPASQSRGLAIQVQGLEKSFKELQVLRGVDFDVERGGSFALLGSNGAGKTTVVKILSTLLKVDAGLPVSTAPTSRRRVLEDLELPRRTTGTAHQGGR
jgi:ABC-type multidrug transport system ATPase subunit